MSKMRVKTRRSRSLSSLMIIILIVNVLPIGLLGFGIFYLDQYKQNMIEPVYEHMQSELFLVRQVLEQGRTSLSEINSVVRGQIIQIDAKGQKIDSYDGAQGEFSETEAVYVNGFLDTMAALMVWLNPLRTELPSFPDVSDNSYLKLFPEVEISIQTQQSSFSAWNTKGDFILTAVVPYHDGVLMMLYDGRPITSSIDAVRLDIMKAFIVVLIVTFLMSVYLSSFIAIPLKKLGRAAEAIRKGRAQSDEIPDMSARRDEIGELSIALRQMTESLHRRIDANERFAADVTHEIKNPLSSLRSAIETALVVKKKEDRDRLMEIIKNDVSRLDKMISDISRISRLDAELARDTLVQVDLNSLLTELVDLWRHPLERGREEHLPPNIILSLNPKARYVMGRADSLAQVFQNLISNALSFSPSDRPIEISVNRAHGDMVQIDVKDYGPGLPEGQINKIFERFYSDRPESHKNDGNSGLGLSIVKQIVESHHGTISAENHYNHKGEISGARFVITLQSAG